jgi:diadenosine tetraphosphate (Ap4A) HIT family hydrolase
VSECIFCEIVAGRAKASIVHEDVQLVAVMDLFPVNPGHVLVIPRPHVPLLSDLDEQMGAHAFTTAMRLQRAIRDSGVRCQGINLLVADGEAAAQDVFHFHLHVVPRFEGDAFRIEADWRKADRKALDRVAADIRESYDRLFVAA